MKYILVAASNPKACDAIRNCFGGEYQVDVTPSRDTCVEMFRKKRYEFTFIDVEFLGVPTPPNGYDDYRMALKPFWHLFPSAEIIVMSSQERLREAVMAVKAGASNYLTYPVDKEEVRYLVESLYESVRTQSELDFLRDTFWQRDSLEVIQTNNPLMKTVFDKIRAVAPTRSTVLLTGETGTGKGVLAKLIHSHSHRSDKQFISLHCGAIPDTLLESELFGHEKGAFTGALRRKLGKFEIAHRGTLLLDEIGTITPSTQIKLLQVLQEKSFQRVGGDESIEVDVRIIAATNSDIKRMSEEGRFRNDLYYRLSVFPIEIPPLRERKEDIPIIARHILEKLNKFHSKGIRDIHPDVNEAFRNYPWPGNIRELENLMERAYILEPSSLLTPVSFPEDLFRPERGIQGISVDCSQTLEEARNRAVEDVERRYLKTLLATHRGRIDGSAKAAGISPRQLHNLMKKYSLQKEEFKSPPYGSHPPEM